MSRGSEIAIGLVCAMLSPVFLMLAYVRANEGQGLATQGVMLVALVAAVAGLLSFALLVKWGRPMTTRVAVGVVSALGLIAMIGAAFSGSFQANGIMWILFSAGGLFYAVTGAYPDSLPLAAIFSPTAVPRKSKKQSTKPKTKRSRLSPLNEE